jgi:hypothetical protein
MMRCSDCIWKVVNVVVEDGVLRAQVELSFSRRGHGSGELG